MVKRLLTSCFGLGFLPVAPGTWGSIPAVVAFVAVSYFTNSVLLMLAVMCLLVIVGGVICVTISDAAIAAAGRKDPSEVVVDELAGQALTFVGLCFGTINRIPDNKVWVIGLAGFLVFRIYDILKPWPARKLEKLPSGWGILADDLMAGLYAAIVVQICVWAWISAVTVG